MMLYNINRIFYLRIIVILYCLCTSLSSFASDSDFPPKPYPPKAVNDFAGFMSPQEQQRLEYSLDSFEKETSIAVVVVTVNSIGSYDASSYTFELGTRWGVGRGKEDNGVVILVSKNDRKYFIATGYGIEASVPDGLAGRIGRDILVTELKKGNYYDAFSKTAEAIFLATKGEYINTDTQQPTDDGEGLGLVGFVIVFVIIFIIIAIISKRGGGGGGNYMSRRGSDFITGTILGNILSGSGSSGGGSWGGFGGGSSGGGGGFGGFGGGSFGGGGAGGSW